MLYVMRTLSLALAVALAFLAPVPAHAGHETTKTTETTSMTELDAEWACWADGNRQCAATPLDLGGGAR